MRLRLAMAGGKGSVWASVSAVFRQQRVLTVTTFCVLLIVFLSTVLRGLAGFGNALIAMPLLVFVVPLSVATPLVGLCAIVMAAVMLAQGRRHIHFGSAWRLVLASAPGVPIGIFFLKNVDEAVVQFVLGLILVLFGVQRLWQPHLIRLKNEASAWCFGFLAGVLGGAYNVSGPPIVLYGVMRRWSPARFRATLQAYFLPAGLFVIAGHAVAGLWTWPVMRYFLLSIPTMLVGLYAGHWLTRFFLREQFDTFVSVLLIALGTMLVVKSIAG